MLDVLLRSAPKVKFEKDIAVLKRAMTDVTKAPGAKVPVKNRYKSVFMTVKRFTNVY